MKSGFKRTPGELDDLQIGRLVRAARNRERWAQDRLIAEARPVIASKEKRLLHEDWLIEELIQEVFAALFEALPSFDTSRDFWPWLHTITRNTTIDHLRKMSGRDEVQFDDVLTDVAYLPLDAEPQEASVILIDLMSALAAIPRDWARPILLKHYIGLTFEEIAAMTGTGLQTWYSRYRKGIEALEDILGEAE